VGPLPWRCSQSLNPACGTSVPTASTYSAVSLAAGKSRLLRLTCRLFPCLLQSLASCPLPPHLEHYTNFWQYLIKCPGFPHPKHFVAVTTPTSLLTGDAWKPSPSCLEPLWYHEVVGPALALYLWDLNSQSS
jgi:hypothetical protein